MDVHGDCRLLSWRQSSSWRRCSSSSQQVKPETTKKRSAIMASAATARAAVSATKIVKPILSRDLDEAKRRVRELYRAWYREVPNTGMLDHCNRFNLIKIPESFKVASRWRFSLMLCVNNRLTSQQPRTYCGRGLIPILG